MFKVIITLIAVIALAIVAGLTVIYGGLYNIAATDHHWTPTRWLISTLTDNAIEHRAQGITVPDNLSDPATIDRGFEHFDEMCVSCHGAPGVDMDEFAEGLYPEAPPLSESAKDMSPAEIYWIVKHGIKMTGMPAFEPTHSESDLWAITAFVMKLPELGESGYRELRFAHAKEHQGDEYEDDETAHVDHHH